MLQDIHLRYRNGCMKLFRMDEQKHLVFVGTAFVVHSEGYLLTVAHPVSQDDTLMVVPPEAEDDFLPVSSEALTAIPVRVAQMDKERDLALLKFTDKVEITTPDHLIGVPENATVGSGVACLGFAFGFQCIYTQVLQQAVVCAKMRSTNGTNLFLFDSRVHDGSRGGPLVSNDDDRVIGVVTGRFDPLEATPVIEGEKPMPTSFSYAVSIEYAVPMMEKEGLDVI
ncbi:S1 family peptidase [Oleidesulfovibrio sp.]|uniref:S1 family peptidase n=1 Tax=Oleidesulfovibrio sp. TaxID=2909707 RepID=UPI003A84C206